ncbi:MAG: tRNA (adenosine(37)-N6)-threonylcarbamoyltransferase complex dimerization subunit type 1 TsaB [Gammaproteobacteria bacterium]|nr:tRNA (adenosine(37)-N6)-threonylcarbamoyltransferase complex dimerization subunit type 1 TsaB [Gammaproteobacteria bacterium]NIN61582.1 tRNA (adenosine(37)-N6)-threonylcarbamoyltransferase complex dimerization subunit type 1 TsaB [Gammaproteobacteria bacterium]NIO62776.1 tRNA (adenosine(37)-N6)-threonylcarbamoyltransferase complex dimerization subunit type 1 TsaB [Gammaproteobacteria bacterium]NIQ09585.1 tRNA (adenosine(37)-N6)-threonylcarbamoyltransferase complex dimerization subunit type 1 
MKLIAIDTTTEACSAALLVNDIVKEQYELAPRQHAELILPMIDSLLSDASLTLGQLDAIAYTCGPGAFTGIRIGAGVAQGLAFSSDLPVVQVSTLATLAQGNRGKAQFIATAIDARMNEIYFAVYRDTGIVELTGAEIVDRAENIRLTEAGSYFGAGSGWARYHEPLSAVFGQNLTGFDGNQYPHAKNTAKIASVYYKQGRICDAADVAPIYIRNKVTG